MKIKVIFILLFSLTFLFISCDNEDMPTQVEAVDEMQSLSKPWLPANEELGERFCAAFANKDLEGVMDCFWNSPDVVLVLENGFVVQGWDNIRAGVQMMMEMYDVLKLEVDEISRFRLGENVYSVGTATWTQGSDGSTVTFTERWTDVSRKVKGKWVYIIDHAHDLRPFELQEQ